MVKQNKPVGFWYRFLARAIDFVAISAFSYLILFVCSVREDGAYHFRYFWLFYIWAFLTAFFFFFLLVLIQILFKGQTIGSWILRMRLTTTNASLTRTIFFRETFFAFGWIAIILVVTVVINHTLIFQVARIKTGSNLTSVLTNWQKTRISVTGSLASFVSLIQMILAITIIPNSEKRGFHDKVANTQVIFLNRFEEKPCIEVLDESILIGRKISEVALEFDGSLKEDEIKW